MADSLIPGRLRAKLLLADPSLRGSIFHHAVILIHDHDSAGAMGIILNHPTGKSVGDFLSMPEFDALKHLPVHIGGPVDGNQMTFSCFWWCGKKGMRWAMRLSPQQAAEHARRPGRILRAFIGYSGWDGGQIEDEMERQSWITLDPKAEILGRSHDSQLWKALMSEISPLHKLMAMAPENFYLN
jgi:putative transcriptional regulator